LRVVHQVGGAALGWVGESVFQTEGTVSQFVGDVADFGARGDETQTFATHHIPHLRSIGELGHHKQVVGVFVVGAVVGDVGITQGAHFGAVLAKQGGIGRLQTIGSQVEGETLSGGGRPAHVGLLVCFVQTVHHVGGAVGGIVHRHNHHLAC